jgi:endonuclease III
MSAVGDIIARLEARFGVPRPGAAKDPLSELIFTILSQNTTDTNRDRAYERLRRRFPLWEDVETGDVADIEEAIRVGGLGAQKSGRIKAILAEIRRRAGALDLSYLDDMSIDEAAAELLSFDGVGRKTAAIVLLFSLGRPAFPVDTHVLRVTKRLGLVPPKAGADAAHDILGGMIPPVKYYPTHINLITLGKLLCRPRNPQCPACPLVDLCPFAAR